MAEEELARNQSSEGEESSSQPQDQRGPGQRISGRSLFPQWAGLSDVHWEARAQLPGPTVTAGPEETCREDQGPDPDPAKGPLCPCQAAQVLLQQVPRPGLNSEPCSQTIFPKAELAH